MGCPVGLVGSADGWDVGLVGWDVGWEDGWPVGGVDGREDGTDEGLSDGREDGTDEGCDEGLMPPTNLKAATSSKSRPRTRRLDITVYSAVWSVYRVATMTNRPLAAR